MADTGPAADVLRAASYRAPRPGPDGRLLAWISDRDGRPRLYVGALEDGAVVEPRGFVPTDLDDPDLPPADVSGVAWSPDGSWLACQLAPGGGERTRVLLVSPDGARRHEIAPGAAAVVLGSWSPSGSHLGVTIYGEGRGEGQACLVDLRDGTSTVLASGPAAVVCAVSGDGHRVVVRHGRRGDRRLELVDLRTGVRSVLVPGGATVADARFGVTGGMVYLHTDADRERPALLAVPLNAGRPGIATPVAERSRPGPARSWCGTSTAAARPRCSTCAAACCRRCPIPRATSSPTPRSPATAPGCCSPARARPSPRRCRWCRWSTGCRGRRHPRSCRPSRTTPPRTTSSPPRCTSSAPTTGSP
ncbi:MAG: hypothetical protein ABS81_23065 [Pseudonocardia sp. SCN 72-86]|nr:MAG: hypothetical protein ABS81_23065 [Pseudonocardia sp. SCN 72-86]